MTVSQPTDTCMTTTPEHCIAAIGLNAHRHERSCHDLIGLSLPARLYASQLGGSCVKPIMYCTSQSMAVLRMFIAPTATTMIGSGCREVM